MYNCPGMPNHEGPSLAWDAYVVRGELTRTETAILTLEAWGSKLKSPQAAKLLEKRKTLTAQLAQIEARL